MHLAILSANLKVSAAYICLTLSTNLSKWHAIRTQIRATDLGIP